MNMIPEKITIKKGDKIDKVYQYIQMDWGAYWKLIKDEESYATEDFELRYWVIPSTRTSCGCRIKDHIYEHTKSIYHLCF